MDFDFNRFGRRPKKENAPIDGETTQALTVLRKGITRRLVIAALAIVAIVLCYQCTVVTMPDEYIVITQFGGIRRITTESGISFKLPFIQDTRSIPRNMRIYDIPISDVITQDKKTMVADSFVLWRVSDPQVFIRNTGGNIDKAESHIDHNTYNSLQSVISRLPQTEIISGRDTLAKSIFDNMGNSLDEFGVELLGIETKHLDLPDENKQAVYTRMISERNNIAASYEAEGEEEARMIRTETEKTVSILLSNATAKAAETIAEGERQYMEILAGAYNDPEKADFYSFVRALDAAKVSLKNGEDNTLILSKDSPIARIFYEN